jgi:hypothetical protein|tara:strand:+ start:84 stop:545 length:462 start_codon:yes stop_codon:yes gene_type:complete
MKDEKKFLERLAQQNNGVLKVDDVIEAAKDESCVLHKHFEWDDTEAAKQFRKDQARSLIQRCRITLVDSSPSHIRAFVSLSSDRESGGGYRLTTTVLSDDSMRLELIHDIELTITRWKSKLHLLDSDLAELLEKMETAVTRRSKTKPAAQLAA